MACAQRFASQPPRARPCRPHDRRPQPTTYAPFPNPIEPPKTSQQGSEQYYQQFTQPMYSVVRHRSRFVYRLGRCAQCAGTHSTTTTCMVHGKGDNKQIYPGVLAYVEASTADTTTSCERCITSNNNQQPQAVANTVTGSMVQPLSTTHLHKSTHVHSQLPSTKQGAEPQRYPNIALTLPINTFTSQLRPSHRVRSTAATAVLLQPQSAPPFGQVRLHISQPRHLTHHTAHQQHHQQHQVTQIYHQHQPRYRLGIHNTAVVAVCIAHSARHDPQTGRNQDSQR